MIKIENYEVVGWEHAIRGMRNPKNSWDRMDTKTINSVLRTKEVAPGVERTYWEQCEPYVSVGKNDHERMMKLAKGGPVHAKYRRMIDVYVDITAPLYWWKEFDTYKVGTVANSCSTMHTIHEKEFTLDDFSCEHLINDVIENFTDMNNKDEDGITFYNNDDTGQMGLLSTFTRDEMKKYQTTLVMTQKDILLLVIDALNGNREVYLKTNDKKYWWQMIQLLPTSYNQKRTVKLNYEVLANIHTWRRNHKLDEWDEFCDWIESLPYSEIILGKEVGEE